MFAYCRMQYIKSNLNRLMHNRYLKSKIPLGVVKLYIAARDPEFLILKYRGTRKPLDIFPEPHTFLKNYQPTHLPNRVSYEQISFLQDQIRDPTSKLPIEVSHDKSSENGYRIYLLDAMWDSIPKTSIESVSRPGFEQFLKSIPHNKMTD